MRKKSLNGIRRFVALSFAVFCVTTGVSINEVYAQNGDWDNASPMAARNEVNLDRDVVVDPANSYMNVTTGTTINGNDKTISGNRNPVTGETNPQLIINTSTDGLIINNVTMTKGGGENGGAIYNDGGKLNVSNSTFTENTTDMVTVDTQTQGNGGAIYNDFGDVTVENSKFENNGVYKDNSGNFIYVDNNGNVTDSSNPQANLVTSVNGGAIYNAANSVISDTKTTLSVNNSYFKGNYAQDGGAIYNEGDATISNSVFEGNKTISPKANSGQSDGNDGRGGAIFNRDGNMTINHSSFVGNTAQKHAGALYNSGGKVEINNQTEFKDNKANNQGGAIGNYRGGDLTVTNAQFSNNSAGQFGGAISNSNVEPGVATGTKAILRVNGNTTFSGNYAANSGGAIYNKSDAIIDTVTFKNNGYSADKAVTTNNGGAIYNDGRSTGAGDNGNIQIQNTTFDSNYAYGSGGAFYNKGDAFIKGNVLFRNNGYLRDADGKTLMNGNTPYVSSMGGAIYNDTPVIGTSETLTIEGTRFEGNVATFGGGAIYNDDKTIIKNSEFINNGITADGTVKTANGGAIYNNKTADIIDSSFYNNQASNGGAIYGNTGSTTNIKAQNTDVNIGTGQDKSGRFDSIYLNETATATFSANDGRSIRVNSTITGSSATNKAIIDINQDASANGTVEFNGKVSNADITLNKGMLAFGNDKHLNKTDNLTLKGGTLNMFNYGVNEIQANQINIDGDINMLVDVDIANKKMDNLLDGTSGTNYLSGSINVTGMRSISDSTAKEIKILFTDVPDIIGNEKVTSNGISTIEGPIYKYRVNQIFDDGTKGDVAGEYFVFNNIGNSDQVMIGPVAAQIGGFLMMDNLYRQSFANMDMTMLMTRTQREALKFRNKYASTADVIPGLYQPSIIGEERDGLYVRPFANFESVPLSGGPKVSNVSYGSLIGGESDIIELGHGWDATYSVFGAYHGSHQAYNGVGIYQNGATLGAVGTVYKGNFFSGLTANVGASGVSANSLAGNESFPMMMSGAAWKSGYNFELKEGKFILQPSFMTSYTWVNVFDYTNASGLSITNDPLNVIELIPGIKLIANLPRGWQPYLGVNMTWNIMDKTRFKAEQVSLTQLSVDPFVEYGVGVQRRMGDRFTGFGQAMIRNGGRNGIALTFGWRWALGD